MRLMILPPIQLRLAALAAAIVLPFTSFPAAANPAQPLGIETALQLASKHHPDLLAQQQQLAIAESERVRAGYWLPDNPTLQGTWTTGDNEFGAAISQPVEVAGQRGLRQEVAELGVAQSKAEIAGFRQSALADAKAAFYDLLYWQERLQLARDVVAVNAELDRVARQRLQAQDIAEVDANLVRISLETARSQQIGLESQRQVAQVALNRLLGQDPATATTVAGPLAPQTPPPAASDAVSQALRQRQDLQALGTQQTVLQRQLDLQHREIIPDPTFSLSYGRRSNTKQNQAAVVSQEPETLQLGVALPIPVVDYRQPQTTRTRAEMALVQARANALRSRIAQDAVQAVTAWRLRQPAAAAYQHMIPQLQENLGLLRAAYREGQVDLQRVLLAQEQLIQTRTALLDVQRQLRQSDIDVDRALGRLAVPAKETP